MKLNLIWLVQHLKKVLKPTSWAAKFLKNNIQRPAGVENCVRAENLGLKISFFNAFRLLSYLGFEVFNNF